MLFIADVGDWERMTVRTVNGVATEVDYHAHDDTGSGFVSILSLCHFSDYSINRTIPWSQVIKFDNGQRPVGYVAKGSHGFWATAGTFTYVNAVVFKLQDVTADGGVAWDTRDSLVTFNYPDTFSGTLDWLNYKGDWGNVGETDCWWYTFYNECQVTAGPSGPLRADVLGASNVKVAAKTGTTSLFSMSGPLSVWTLLYLCTVTYPSNWTSTPWERFRKLVHHPIPYTSGLLSRLSLPKPTILGSQFGRTVSLLSSKIAQTWPILPSRQRIMPPPR